MTTNGSKKSILTQVGHFSSATLLTHLVTMIAVFLTRKFLGPLQMGIWSIMQVVLTYSMYCSLGVTYGIVQKVPFYRGKKDYAKADEIRDVSISFSMFMTGLVSAGILIYAICFRTRLKPEIFHGLLFASVIIFLTRVNNLLITILRAYKEFTLAGKQMFFSAIVNALFIALLAYSFKLYGFMLAICFSLIFNIVYMWMHYRFPIKWNLNIALIKELIVYGFLLISIDFLGNTALTADRIVIAKFLGLEAVGLYSIAQLTWNYVFAFPNSISIIFGTNIQEKYGERERIDHLKGFVSKSLTALSSTMPFIIGALWFLGPSAIHLILPKFINGLIAMQCLLLGTFFASLYTPLEQFLVAIKKQLPLLFLGGLWILFAFSFNFIAVNAGLGIGGVAASMAFVAMLRFIVLFFISGAYLFSKKELWLNFFQISGRFIYLLVLLVGLSQIKLFQNQLITDGFNFAVFLLLYSPIFFYLNKQLEIIPIFLAYFKGKWGFKPATQQI